MIKVSLFVALAGVSAFANQKNALCEGFYNKLNAADAKAARVEQRQANRAIRVGWAKERKETVDRLYEPMFVKQFESEFSLPAMEPGYRDLFKRLLFDPESLTTAEWNIMRSGSPYNTKVTEENPNASTLKYYLNKNHLTSERQENDAEAILSRLRGVKVELTQLEIVALRVARIIGRDYDFFIGTPYEVPEARIKSMKARFLSSFSFAGKTLSDKELNALYDAYVTNDSPVSTYRYDISQVYDFKRPTFGGREVPYITVDMIAKRNQRIVEAGEKFKNPVLTEGINRKLANPKTKAELTELNSLLDKDAGLAESLRFIRLAIFDQHGVQNPFKTAGEFAEFVKQEYRNYEIGMAKLKEPGMSRKVKLLMEDMSEETNHSDHVAALKVKLASSRLSPADRKKMIDFMESKEGMRLFSVVRDEYHRMDEPVFGKKRLDIEDLEGIFKRKLGLIQETLDLSVRRPDLFKTAHEFKILRTGLTETEVKEIFKIAQRNPAMRLASLLKFDPLARYGFCFGRAYWFQRMLLAHGVHPDSIGKVLVDGKMSGGLTGWAWHIAATVEREGGGVWVLDQSHGEPQSLTTWFNHYRDHIDKDGDLEQGASKDDRIKIFLTPGERFGRTDFRAQDFAVMETQYESIWNKLGADVKYFRDVGQQLEADQFNDEAKSALRSLSDGLLDALKLGF